MSPRSFKFYIKNLVIYAFIGSLIFGATALILERLVGPPDPLVAALLHHPCDRGHGSAMLHYLYDTPLEKRPELWEDIQLNWIGLLPSKLTPYGEDNVLQTLKECGYSPSRDWVKKLFE